MILETVGIKMVFGVGFPCTIIERFWSGGGGGGKGGGIRRLMIVNEIR